MDITLKTTNRILFLTDVTQIHSDMSKITFEHKNGKTNIPIKMRDDENEYYEPTEEVLKNYASLIMDNAEDLYFTVTELLKTSFINTVYDNMTVETERLIIDLTDVFIVLNEALLKYGLTLEWDIQTVSKDGGYHDAER